MQEEAAEIKGMRTMGPPPVRRARHSPVHPPPPCEAPRLSACNVGQLQLPDEIVKIAIIEQDP